MNRRLHVPPSRTVAEIPRGTGEVLRVRLFGDPPTHVDVRSFGARRHSDGEPRPSRETGFTLKLDQAPALARALLAAKEAAR